MMPLPAMSGEPQDVGTDSPAGCLSTIRYSAGRGAKGKARRIHGGRVGLLIGPVTAGWSAIYSALRHNPP